MEKFKFTSGVPNKFVHVMSTANGEYTLCGDAFECGEVDGVVDADMNLTDEKINCPVCVSVITMCKSIKSSEIKNQ